MTKVPITARPCEVHTGTYLHLPYLQEGTTPLNFVKQNTRHGISHFEMDFDLVPDDMDDSEIVPRILPGNLLSNLPNRPLTAPEEDASTLQIPRFSSPVIGHTYRNHQSTPGAVISKIEDIFEAITDCLLKEGEELVIPLKTRSRNKTKTGNVEATQNNSRSETRSVSFPNKSPQEARRFSELADFQTG